MEKSSNSRKIVDFTRPKMAGECIGLYLSGKSRYQYEYEKILAPVNVTAMGGISTLLPAKRSHAADSFGTINSGRVLEDVNEQFMFKDYEAVLSQLYKPYLGDQVNKRDFQGPVTQFKGLVRVRGRKYHVKIEKLIYRNKEIFFGTVNNKLAIYSVLNSNGKRKMQLHGLEKLTEEQNNTKYLKERASKALFNLLGREKKRIARRVKPAYSVNWPDYSEGYKSQEKEFQKVSGF